MKIETIICSNNDAIKKIPIENCTDFDKLMKELDINFTKIFIKGELYFKFYGENIIIVPEDNSYVYYNVCTKHFMIGSDFNFNLIVNEFKILIEKDS